MDAFEALIHEFGAACGIEDLAPEEDGAVELLFDGKLTVFLQPDVERRYLSIYAPVGKLDKTVAGPLMLELLSASLFGREANGASFAIEASTGQIVLQHSERLEGFALKELERVLEAFLDAAEAWMRRLSPLSEGDEGNHKDLLGAPDPAQAVRV